MSIVKELLVVFSIVNMVSCKANKKPSKSSDLSDSNFPEKTNRGRGYSTAG